MPIFAIIEEPGSSLEPKVVPAYRPIVFRIAATRTDGSPVPPIVFCDIYLDDVFYKSIAATQYDQLNAINTEWEFDISDACQEYLKRDLPINGGSTIVTASKYAAQVYCRFRSSGYDINGFIIAESVAPQQATGSTAAASGGGQQSEDFLVLNATLQHDANQDLLTHLQYAISNGNYDPQAYPLSHRPSPYRICKTDSDYFPFIYLGANPFLKLCVSYKLKNSNAFVTTCYNIPQVCNSVVSNVGFNVQPNEDIQVGYNATAPATDFEYQIDNGSWLTVPSNPFTIKYNQLLMYLITEAGEIAITDQDGNIIIPQDVIVYDVDHTITIRPRCSNGVYGTPGANMFNLPSAPACTPLLLFQENSHDFQARTITLDINMPAGKTDFQLEWKVDYNGYVTAPTLQDYSIDPNNPNVFVWNIPQSVTPGGKIILRARTKCSDASFSAYSPEVDVIFDIPLHNVNLTIQNLSNSGNTYELHLHLSEPLTDEIVARGYFRADAVGGFVSTFGFAVTIPIGQVDGYASVGNAPAGGGVVAGSARIEQVTPNPTSSGEKIIF